MDPGQTKGLYTSMVRMGRTRNRSAFTTLDDAALALQVRKLIISFAQDKRLDVCVRRRTFI